jgi:prolyl oligopeptidase
MLVEGFAAGYTFADSRGDALYFRTNAEAPRGRLVKVDPTVPSRWQEVIPERQEVLMSATLVGDRVIGHYLQDARSAVTVFDAAGRPLRALELPGIGSAAGFTGDPGSPETFFSFESFSNPGEIWRYDVATGARQPFRRAAVKFDPDQFVVEQVFFASKDGTRIPMFIVHRRDLKRDGDNATLLYGYGGFNISLPPDFSAARLAWLEMGGVYAVANLRGGGEYGEQWHAAGTRLAKQNVFDDFIAAAEHLIAENYTRPDKLGISGGSNGGLLVGAVSNQRPELFGAALPAVGVMDMLRFHHFTAGRFWTDDYGSADDPEEFQALYAYSPYHNIRDGACYPAVLATTADTDDRVIPGHSFKYMARLQQAQGCDRPVLIRVETRAGHGAGKPTEMIIEEYADRWAFLVENLRLELPKQR